jgi:Lar family restriction alleviation protein
MASLKPCPFCGDVVGLILKDKMVDCRYHEYSIYCEGCETNGPNATKERTPEEAIKKWNRRAILSGGGNRASDEFIATGECQKSPETKKTYVVGGVIPKSIAGWSFEDAPRELQALSNNGGDEDCLAEPVRFYQTRSI